MCKGYKPNLGFLRVWNRLAFVRLIDPKIPKLGVRATICASLRYVIDSIAYRYIYIYIYSGFQKLRQNIFSEPSFSTPYSN